MSDLSILLLIRHLSLVQEFKIQYSKCVKINQDYFWSKNIFVFMMLTVKKTTPMLIFCNMKLYKHVPHYIILVIALERFRIVTYSFAARFEQKRVFIKFTTFFISRTKQIYTKLINVSESILKIKMKSC